MPRLCNLSAQLIWQDLKEAVQRCTDILNKAIVKQQSLLVYSAAPDQNVSVRITLQADFFLLLFSVNPSSSCWLRTHILNPSSRWLLKTKIILVLIKRRLRAVLWHYQAFSCRNERPTERFKGLKSLLSSTNLDWPQRDSGSSPWTFSIEHSYSFRDILRASFPPTNLAGGASRRAENKLLCRIFLF